VVKLATLLHACPLPTHTVLLDPHPNMPSRSRSWSMNKKKSLTVSSLVQLLDLPKLKNDCKEARLMFTTPGSTSDRSAKHRPGHQTIRISGDRMHLTITFLSHNNNFLKTYYEIYNNRYIRLHWHGNPCTSTFKPAHHLPSHPLSPPSACHLIP
jgi:hypothetical protein